MIFCQYPFRMFKWVTRISIGLNWTGIPDIL
jgi:hypothetical protein